ncbi:DUF6191 domain-containing protein [Amycolatopsis sp. CA-230715]|uniref:DUF6191 domain-containing protein n=1 Tax=Amycolatopsis sp. CA-230715 TaxID=2745196 RepID=UPI001C0354EF|nr:DUF6191 domain-containing protein [Amycolatopsis sp. CA-230715]QWF82209.1 hypothetical protein HUW46_05646 [Amycolatopsis sp. CA-230715]
MDVAVVWIMSVPGLMFLLLFGIVLERMIRWARDRRRGVEHVTGMGRGKRLAAARGTEELFAFLFGTKRNELERRDVELVLRQDEEDGAPPGNWIDLDSGVVRLDAPKLRGTGPADRR